jgi:hypothetical protein
MHANAPAAGRPATTAAAVFASPRWVRTSGSALCAGKCSASFIGGSGSRAPRAPNVRLSAAIVLSRLKSPKMSTSIGPCRSKASHTRRNPSGWPSTIRPDWAWQSGIAVAQQPRQVALQDFHRRRIGASYCNFDAASARSTVFIPARRGQLGREEIELIVKVGGTGIGREPEGGIADVEIEAQLASRRQPVEILAPESAEAAIHEGDIAELGIDGILGINRRIAPPKRTRTMIRPGSASLGHKSARTVRQFDPFDPEQAGHGRGATLPGVPSAGRSANLSVVAATRLPEAASTGLVSATRRSCALPSLALGVTRTARSTVPVKGCGYGPAPLRA